MAEWSEAAVGRLRELWADAAVSKGAIAATLNKEFGGGFNRNSVAGKVNKLKLPRRDGKLRPGEVDRAAEAHRLGAAVTARAIGSIAIMNERDGAPDAIPDEQFVCTTDELTDISCRYPIGDRGNYKHCGFPEANMTLKKPYCEFHAQVCSPAGFYSRRK
jgi:hypothetical protein